MQQLIKVNIKESILDGIVCMEEIDPSVLDKLIKSSLLIQNDDWNEKLQLKAYKKLISYDGVVKVQYFKNKHKIGRVNPKLGLITLRRAIKQTLTKERYIDIDIVNCHPILLQELCKGLDIPCLLRYNRERTDIVNQICDDYGFNKDTAKSLIISIIYGGSYETFFKKHSKKVIDTSITNFITEFEKEIKRITELFVSLNPDIVKKVEKSKKYNIDGSVLSFIVQEYENQILETIYTYCCDKKVIVNNDCVLSYDGIMIKKDRYYSSLLDELQTEIFNRNGFQVKLLNKEMEDDYLNQLDNTNTEKEYETMKYDFELNHFKLMNPISYVYKDCNDEIYCRSRTDFIGAYENKLYSKGDKRVSFIKEWMQDENIRTYQCIRFSPDGDTPENIYNSFRGFEAKKRTLTPCAVKETLIYKHMMNLCNNDMNVIKYFEMFLSRKVKNPSKLTNTSLIFKSTQGVGKDTFFDWYGKKILGYDYYCNEIDTDLLFGKFNGILTNKILCIIAESSSKKNMELTQDIKDAITRTVNTIKEKGKEPVKHMNCCSYIFLTNLENPILLPIDDRRFVAINCNNEISNNYDYFKALRNEIDSGTVDRAFYEYLMELDSDNFDFNDRPKTELYEEMKDAHRDVMIDFLEDLINENKRLDIKNLKLYASDFFELFNTFIRKGNFNVNMSIKKFGMKLKQYNCISKRTHKGMLYDFKYDDLEQYLINKGLIKANQD